MTNPLAQRLISLAERYAATAPSDIVDESEPILVRIPGRDRPLAMAVFEDEESGGDGLMLFLDDDAAEKALRTFRDDGPEPVGAHIAMLRFTPPRELAAPFKKVLQAGGHKNRPGRLAPVFAVNAGDEEWRPIQRGEARPMALALFALLEWIDATGGSDLDDLSGDETIELSVSSDEIERPDDPAVKWEIVEVPTTDGRPNLRLVSDEEDPSGDSESRGVGEVVDLAVTRLVDGLSEDDRLAAFETYFGDALASVALDGEGVAAPAMRSFCVWAALDPAASGGRSSLVDAALANPAGVAERERGALEALQQSDPALVRFQVEDDDSVLGVDLGTRQEHALSDDYVELEGVVAPVRMLTVEGVTLPIMIGPPLVHDLGEAYREFFGEEITREVLRRMEPRMGELWQAFLDLARGEMGMPFDDDDVELDDDEIDATIFEMWLDEAHPDLDGYSPRQAVRVVELRPKVSEAIKNLGPLEYGDRSVEPPRQEMLEELGLDG